MKEVGFSDISSSAGPAWTQEEILPRCSKESPPRLSDT